MTTRDDLTPGASPLVDLKAAVAQMGDRMGALEATVAEKADAALSAEMSGLKSAVDGLAESAKKWETPTDYAAPLKAVTDRLDAVEAAAAMPGGNAADTEVKSLAAVIHESDGFKSYRPGEDKRIVIPSGNFGAPIPMPSVFGLKAGPVLSTDINPYAAQRPGVFTPSQENMDLAARLMRQPAPGATTWTSRRETADSLFGYTCTALSAAVTNPSTTAEVDAHAGFMIGADVRFFLAGGGVAKTLPLVDITRNADGSGVLTFDTDALDFASPEGAMVLSDNWAATPEGEKKPEGWAEIEMIPESLKTLATLLPVSEQALSSEAGLNAWIEQKLRRRAMRNLSRHVIKGNNNNYQLMGFDNVPGALEYLWSDGAVGDNRFDAVIKAAAQIPWVGEIVIGLNKLDFVNTLLTKGEDGHYVQSTAFGQLGLVSVGGRLFIGPFEVVLDETVVPGDFYVINLTEASEIVDAQTSTMAWGYMDNQFGRNVITARYEDRLLHSILNVGAFVKGEWDDPPTAP